MPLAGSRSRRWPGCQRPFDISLFKWNVFGLWPDDYWWQITTAIDLARAYGSFSFGIGGWY